MANYKGAGSATGKGKVSVRVPLITDEHIDEFTGATINSRSGLLYNGIVDRYSGDKERVYITQRPAVNIFSDSSADAPSSEGKGRGMHFWSANDTRYFVNGSVVYKDTYSTPCAVATVGGSATAMVTGTGKVYFAEWTSAYNSYLFIIVPESDQLFVIQNTEVTAIGDNDLINMTDVAAVGTTGTGAPFHASETWDLAGWNDVVLAANGTQAGGAVELDNYLFLATKSGRIYNSNVDNYLHWEAIDFITAERENDFLVYIDKHKDHVVGFGTKSIELFYDAANATASPLSTRKDIYFNIGMVSTETAWRDGNDIYFLGMKPNGDFHMFTLKDYQLEEDSTSTIDSYMRHGRLEADLYTVLSGFSTGNHVYALLTVFNSTAVPQLTLVYDAAIKMWYEWETTLVDQTHFPLISWSTRTPETPVTAEGIFSNGDIFYVEDNFVPIDQVSLLGAYFAADYTTPLDAVTGYSASSAAAGSTSIIALKVEVANIEFDSADRKFMHSCKYVGNQTTNAQTINVAWSDDDKVTWNSGTIDVQSKTQVNRLGSFERRAFRLTYTGDEQIRAEALEITFSQGSS